MAQIRGLGISDFGIQVVSVRIGPTLAVIEICQQLPQFKKCFHPASTIWSRDLNCTSLKVCSCVSPLSFNGVRKLDDLLSFCKRSLDLLTYSYFFVSNSTYESLLASMVFLASLRICSMIDFFLLLLSFKSIGHPPGDSCIYYLLVKSRIAY